MRILVIDDDKNIRYFISGYLVTAGYEVIEAQDGQEGIDVLKADDDIHMVITDIRMPDKDGNDVVRYVRQSYTSKNIPVVAITGYPDDAEGDLFTRLFEKPFKMKDLVKVMKSFE